MGYTNLTSRTDASALIPEVVSSGILQGVAEANPLMRLAKRLPNMSTNQTRIPVVSALPVAYFVSGDNGLKQTTEVNWANKYIDAEELAVIVPIPQAVLDDANYDIWGQARPLLVDAFNIAITNAVLWGTNIPATWTTDLGAAGLKAVCDAASQTLSLAAYADIYEALLGETAAGVDGCWMAVEADGFTVTGGVYHPSVKGMLRNLRDSNGNPIFKSSVQGSSAYEIDGTASYFPTDGTVPSATALGLMGQWDQLVYAMRQDITYSISTQGVIQDGAGNIVYNLFQQDMVALRAVMRLGFALPNPLNRMQATAASRCAFACLTA